MIWGNYRIDNAKSYLCRADCPVLFCVLVGDVTFRSAVWVYSEKKTGPRGQSAKKALFSKTNVSYQYAGAAVRVRLQVHTDTRAPLRGRLAAPLCSRKEECNKL